MKVTIEDIRLYLEKNPSLLGDIKRMMDYRNLRTEQVFYAKLLYEYRNYDNLFRVSKMVEQAREWDKGLWEDKNIQLDKNRRQYHNRALVSFARMVRIGRANELPEIFEGEVLTEDAIYKHEDPYGMSRERMTDAMFEMLYSIERGVLQQESEAIQEIQSDMDKFNYQYHVQKSMRSDESIEVDGGVKFDRDLATIFDTVFAD